VKGQWLGTYTGSTEGNLMVNIDEVDDHYEAVAYISPSTKELPSSVAYLHTANKNQEQESVAYLNAVDPRTWFQVEWEEIKDLYGENVVHSKEAKVKLRASGNSLKINAVTDIGITFNSILEKPPEKEESKILGEKMSWGEFKLHVSAMSKARYIFRGQRKPWKLCTSYHRRGRYRISEFVKEDVKQLHRRLSAITSHFFDLNQPDQNGAFFSLLQHHGYPTPLLDWTYSPYVAAFFAFRNWPIKYSGDDEARVYIFNNKDWQKNYPQIQILDPPFPHLSVMEFLAIDNPRLVPQQTVTTVTNIYDIEAYVLGAEKNTSVKYLEAIDIPAREREVAMEDLRFMGITAGSMFPSIDGVCEELRERNFEK
jgi:hypothetical protein